MNEFVSEQSICFLYSWLQEVHISHTAQTVKSTSYILKIAKRKAYNIKYLSNLKISMAHLLQQRTSSKFFFLCNVFFIYQMFNER